VTHVKICLDIIYFLTLLSVPAVSPGIEKTLTRITQRRRTTEGMLSPASALLKLMNVKQVCYQYAMLHSALGQTVGRTG
jgi:hypothetical protein